jgi:RNA polymerase sigma-70 factor, ECF subfamily
VSDRELIEALRQGDEEAFSTLFRKYYPALVGMAGAVLRDSAVAEEVVQEVFLELWRRAEELPVEDSYRGYLFRATRNRALNRVRRQAVEKKHQPLLVAPDSIDPDAPGRLREEEIDRALLDAIETLPDRCRQIFEMSRMEGLKYTEIASELGISVKAVEAQMGKALKALRELLLPWVSDEGN